MPEFDTLLTGEEVARNLKVSKDRVQDHWSRVRNGQKSSTVFRRCCSVAMAASLNHFRRGDDFVAQVR